MGLLICVIGFLGFILVQTGTQFRLDPLREIGRLLLVPTPIEWWYHSGLKPVGYSPTPATLFFVVVAVSGGILGTRVHFTVD